ncbi:MAG: prenyltransferase/squalene oxidase repeat-containing protein [Planctomycetota bacterium]
MIQKMKLVFALVLAACGSSAPAPTSTAQGHSVDVMRAATWLASRQHDDGRFGEHQPDLGITALCARALHQSNPEAFQSQIDKAVKVVLASQVKGGGEAGKPVGAFSDADGKFLNYKTCVCIQLLHDIDPVAHRQAIKAGQDYIQGLQFTDEKNVRDFGAIGYGSKPVGDLSNTQFALEALAETGVPKDSAVFQRAKDYLTRLQNFRKNPTQDPKLFDGGFPYGIAEAGDGKSEKKENPNGESAYGSYGSMTYAGLKSMIYASLDARDARVQAALAWIGSHYTLDENPGLARANDPALGQQGLFYYYHTFAKALRVAGVDKLNLTGGTKADWKSDLREALAKRQSPEGFWINPKDRWWEGDSQLVTAYALMALHEAR